MIQMRIVHERPLVGNLFWINAGTWEMAIVKLYHPVQFGRLKAGNPSATAVHMGFRDD